MTTHDLKIAPEFFAAIACHDKTFEIRDCRDRTFVVGDTLRLREYGPHTGDWPQNGYTNRELTARVSYITSWGQPEGQVVMGLRDVRVKQ
jgi:hypothetical protein